VVRASRPDDFHSRGRASAPPEASRGGTHAYGGWSTNLSVFIQRRSFSGRAPPDAAPIIHSSGTARHLSGWGCSISSSLPRARAAEGGEGRCGFAPGCRLIAIANHKPDKPGRLPPPPRGRPRPTSHENHPAPIAASKKAAGIVRVHTSILRIRRVTETRRHGEEGFFPLPRAEHGRAGGRVGQRWWSGRLARTKQDRGGRMRRAKDFARRISSDLLPLLPSFLSASPLLRFSAPQRLGVRSFFIQPENDESSTDRTPESVFQIRINLPHSSHECAIVRKSHAEPPGRRACLEKGRRGARRISLVRARRPDRRGSWDAPSASLRRPRVPCRPCGPDR